MWINEGGPWAGGKDFFNSVVAEVGFSPAHTDRPHPLIWHFNWEWPGTTFEQELYDLASPAILYRTPGGDKIVIPKPRDDTR